MTLIDILKPNKKKKLIVFGTGSLAIKVASWLVDFKIEYFVDNAPDKWGEYFLDLPIKKPDQISNEPKGTFIVLIASSFVSEIEAQLKSMGLISREDMIDCNYISYTAAGEFYSPLPDINYIKEKSSTSNISKTQFLPGIELNTTEQISLLDKFKKHIDSFPYSDSSSCLKLRYPKTKNSFFEPADAINLYCFMNEFKPKNIIEVGSGYTSALMLDINENQLSNKVNFTFIEPYPERLLSLISDEDINNVTIHKMALQQVPLSIFDTLENNDILFIDSSHVVKFDSDVNWLLSEIIPRLKNGVIIHFHDIQYPFEYPKHWLEEGRAWNEAYMLRSFLQYNNSFNIIYWNSFLTKEHRKELDINFSEFSGGSSIYIKKVI